MRHLSPHERSPPRLYISRRDVMPLQCHLQRVQAINSRISNFFPTFDKTFLGQISTHFPQALQVSISIFILGKYLYVQRETGCHLA